MKDMKDMKDWTAAGGRANSSAKFEELVGHVAKLISGSAHDLINGSNRSVARLIVAQLAHKHGMQPVEPAVT